MTEDKKHIDHLIARYLTGEANESERLELLRWQDALKENKQYFDQMLFVHEQVLSSRKTVPINIDRGWNNLKQKMAQPRSERVEKNIGVPFYQSTWMRIAAALIIIIGISLWLYITYNSSGLSRSKTIAVESQNKTLNYALSDNSQIFLNKNSKITYTSNFGKKQREVTLTGEAYFNVKHETKPFIVKADETWIKDIGTSFNIKAFPDSDIVRVFVEAGEIMFYTTDNPGIKLNKGETGVYQKSSKSFKKYSLSGENALSYMTRIFVFQNARLSEVIEQLNPVYQTKITLTDSNLGNCKITVKFNNEDIDKIVSIIGETLGIQITKTSDGFILAGNPCLSQ